MDFWKSVTILLTVSCIGFTAIDTDSTNLFVEPFSKLTERDTLKVRYASQGCFGGSAYEFAFRAGSIDTVDVARGLSDPNADNESFWRKLAEDLPNLVVFHKKSKQPDRQLGQLELTQSDLQEFDKLLSYYRSSRTSGCTTTTTIEISQVRDGKTIAVEKFVDESCSSYRERDLVGFTDLVERLEQKKTSNLEPQTHS